ncbi:DNA polymerase III subunit gamma/tau [Desulfatirhabdium butyrativorans]|uniref:DNA polymerase III subunit gamma/tau n=1 Tax=Desulfatirhabdium butyrativorans TaxID=340467 RepID=UPI0004102EE9|nr:DNA polymerase III subunit gamma/tau [Desulfatirhabdium butyrativorans]
MSYLVLARKYRPQTFEEIVQQEHVTQTLIHAIEANRVAHAILFSGPRGTGKTTIARILAKALNCEQGPTPKPCGVCASCKEIATGLTVDVFEIDGASNNSVDQIRELRENIVYLPVHGRFKIYIIDEVHMLSMAAFNALLKTLEEPPAHIKFFFATTEPQKIPATILSRCQRHDLKRITLQAIVDHLQRIAITENITISEDCLRLIAREATGGMRDALSLLDQVISFCEGAIEYADVIRLFGVIDRRILIEFSNALLKGQPAEALEHIHLLYETGKDLKRFYADCMDHIRNLLLARLGITDVLLDSLSPEEIAAIQGQAASIDVTRLRQLLDAFHRDEPAVRFAANPRLVMEMVVFKWIEIRPALSIDRLIDAIDRLIQNPALNAAPPAHTDGFDAANDTVERRSTDTRIQEARTRFETPLGAKETVSAQDPQEIRAGFTDTIAENIPLEGTQSNTQPVSGPADLLERLRDRLGREHNNMSLPGFLADACIVEIKGDDVTLALNAAPPIAARIRKNEGLLRQSLSELLGKPIHLQLLDRYADPQPTPSAVFKTPTDIRTEALNHPKVSEIIDIFGGSVVDIRITKEEVQ